MRMFVGRAVIAAHKMQIRVQDVQTRIAVDARGPFLAQGPGDPRVDHLLKLRRRPFNVGGFNVQPILKEPVGAGRNQPQREIPGVQFQMPEIHQLESPPVANLRRRNGSDGEIGSGDQLSG